MPRMIILLLDTLITLIGCTMLTISDLYRYGVHETNLHLKIGLILAIFVTVNLFTRSYQSIIRLSVMEDLYRIFLTVIISTGILIFINLSITSATQIPLYSYWSLFILSSIIFTMLLLSRLAIKYIFIQLNAQKSPRERIIILGASLDSIMLARTLKNEDEGKFEPVALLSTSEKVKNSKAYGFPIEKYSKESIEKIFSKYGTTTLVFMSSQKNWIQNGNAENFLENNISLLLLNQIEEYNIKSEESDKHEISSYIKNIEIEDLLEREPINFKNPLVKMNIHNKCVLITGAAGSIGSEIVRQVATFGAKRIILIDQAETPMHNMQLEMAEKFPDTKILLFIGDIKDRKRMEEVFQKYRPEFVFHAAAYKHVPMMEINPSQAILTNVMGTKNIADLALKYNAYKFVMISTDKAVNPSNIMGASKRLAEIYVQSLFFNSLRNYNSDNESLPTQFITTRFGNVLGSNGSVIPLFRSQIEKGGPITITHKDIIRYFMTISEACSLVLEAGSMGRGGEIYIFDMGKPVRIYDLACKMVTLAGLKVNQDINIVETGLRPGEKLYEELLNDKEKTQATVNRKIMIAKVAQYDYDDVCKNLSDIIEAAEKDNIHEFVYKMKSFIPEFKSNNSKFEIIDNEIKEHQTTKDVDLVRV